MIVSILYISIRYKYTSIKVSYNILVLYLYIDWLEDLFGPEKSVNVDDLPASYFPTDEMNGKL